MSLLIWVLIMINLVVKNALEFKQNIEKYENTYHKMYVRALRITGYHHRAVLQDALEFGHHPGANIAMKRISKLSRLFQSRYGTKLYSKMGRAFNYDAPPMNILAGPIRYVVRDETDKQQARLKVGTVGRISKSWMRIFGEEQRGAQIPITQKMREYFMTFPRQLATDPRKAKGIKIPENKHFFDLPSRQVIIPYLQRENQNILNEIKNDFYASMAKKIL